MPPCFDEVRHSCLVGTPDWSLRLTGSEAAVSRQAVQGLWSGVASGIHSFDLVQKVGDLNPVPAVTLGLVQCRIGVV
jgi:hypothetical protein